MIPQLNETKVYQLRIWLKKISPMIWRRLLVRSDSSIADLHHTIQMAMGWEDEYLNQFVIHGKTLGVYHDGGISFSTRARNVFLHDFMFTTNERFLYEYNFFDHWEHEVRIEKLLPINPEIIYPCCIGGKRAAPPEGCGGPKAFMELQDYYSPWRIEEKLISLVRRRINLPNDTEDDEDDEDLEDNPESTLETLKYWIDQRKFSCRAANRRLQEFFKENQH